MLGRFDPAAVELFPPASAEDVRLAQGRVGLALPPSLRAFLAFSNGMRLSYGSLYGVASGWGRTMEYGSIEEESERWRAGVVRDLHRKKKRGVPPEPGTVSAAIAVVGGEGTGDAYVLLDDLRDASGECAVALVDHENLRVMAIVASSYERFMWFFVDDISRKAEPGGEEKLDEDEIAPSDWPFANKARMLEHDPGLAKWL